MMLIRWKDTLINVDGLRDTYYDHTHYRVTLKFSTGENVLCYVSSDKELDELFNRIFMAVNKKNT